MEKTRVLIWDLPTRVFHWLLAASFLGAFLTAESERWRDVHVVLGYTMLGLVAFRLLWGAIGTRYARFSSFAFGPGRVLAYLKSLLTFSPQHYPGHNPAGSWAIFALLALIVAAGLTGVASYEGIGGDWMSELHEGVANALLAVVLVHVTGVLVSSLVHQENLVRSMLDGFKSGGAGQGIRRRHRIVAALLLLAVVGFWIGGKAILVPGAGAGANEAATARRHAAQGEHG